MPADGRGSGARYSVLRVTERLPPLPGGKEVHVASLTGAQVASGHRVRVLYRYGDGERLPCPSERVRVPAVAERCGGLASTAWFSARAARAAARSGAFDVVHVHGDLSEAWWLSGPARRCSAPLVMTVHGRLNQRFRLPSRAAFRAVAAFVALGDGVRQDLLLCGVPQQRITVMSSGLDLELLSAAGTRRAEPGLVVAVGSLLPVKDLATAVAAVLALPPHVHVRLDIIGDGPDRSRLSRMAAGSARVRFLGHLSRAALYDRVSSAEVFVMASKRLRDKGEGVPTALLEAMALGRTCVVSDQATPSAVVDDSGCYLTFGAGDVEGLTVLLAELLTGARPHPEPERVRRAVAHLGWSRVAERIDDVYASALDGYRGQR